MSLFIARKCLKIIMRQSHGLGDSVFYTVGFTPNYKKLITKARNPKDLT